ncbi:MAG: amidohydrolase family protein, partial [Caldimonas sp.]
MPPETTPALLWAPLAWLPDGWRKHVLLRAGADGRWAEITADVAAAPDGAHVVAGPLLPGVVDAHSHAFQRAFAGTTERRDAASDDFWSWRERMYAVALRIGPEQLRAVAAQLYVELLRGGYTHVCEFHYLRRDRDGAEFADPLAMSWALADAAADAGIGLTILPVLYERAGFAADSLRDEQRRFRASAVETFDAALAIRA